MKTLLVPASNDPTELTTKMRDTAISAGILRPVFSRVLYILVE
jgi:hypothetical protein